MGKKHVFAVVGVMLAVASSASWSEAQSDRFPFDVVLVKPLGFRARPGLDAAPVLPNLNYLQPPARLKVTGATGPLWQPNTFCQAEFQGRSGYIRCDVASNMVVVPTMPASAAAASTAPASTAPATTTGGGQCTSWQKTIPNVGLKLCTDPTTCKAFCECQCTLDPRKWGKEKNDGSTTCPGILQSGPGMLPPTSNELTTVSAMPNIEMQGTVKATQTAIDGLTRLNAAVEASAWKSRFKLRVKSCYRPHLEDTEPECGYVLKAQHIFKKYATTPPSTPAERESFAWAQRAQDPMKLGLSYPGATPHSAGNACDIVMVNRATNREMFGFTADDNAATHEASRFLDEAVTKAGGRRLAYEAWHYEWGTTRGCTFPDCDKFWPPKGSP